MAAAVLLKPCRGAFPGQFQPFGVAPDGEGEQRGGGFAVRGIAVEVEAAAFVVEQVQEWRGKGAAEGEAEAAVALCQAGECLPVGEAAPWLVVRPL